MMVVMKEAELAEQLGSRWVSMMGLQLGERQAAETVWKKAVQMAGKMDKKLVVLMVV